MNKTANLTMKKFQTLLFAALLSAAASVQTADSPATPPAKPEPQSTTNVADATQQPVQAAPPAATSGLAPPSPKAGTTLTQAADTATVAPASQPAGENGANTL